MNPSINSPTSMTDPTFHTTLPSPLGPLLLLATSRGLRQLSLVGQKPSPALSPSSQENPAPFAETARQLAQYFSGTRRSFDLPLDLHGTPFQRHAWASLLLIPYGTTASYQQQAAALGRPTATRALGAAYGRNPLCLILPCHRVIGANHSLTGYSGGLPAKAWLLAHESHHLALQSKLLTAEAT